jgi:hypothetical protein
MATQAVATIRQRLQGKFGSSITSLGVHNCRKKRKRDGTTFDGWSQHAWSNAWDFRVSSALVSAVEAELDQLETEGVSAGYISYGDGQFHVDGAPRRDPNKKPPCAGGKPQSNDDGGGGQPDVMNPPRQETTAGAPPGGPEPTGDPDEAETVEGNLTPDVPGVDVPGAGALEAAGDLATALTDPNTWKRVAWAIGGIILVVLSVYMLTGDLLLSGSAGRATQAAAGALKGN